MADEYSTAPAGEGITKEDWLPIDFEKDSDEVLCKKIDSRVSDSKPVVTKKREEYREDEWYLLGMPQKVDPSVKPSLKNHLFPIVRNMTGLITDAKPSPTSKVVRVDREDKEQMKKYLQLADHNEQSLEDWWEQNRMQSRLGRIVFSMQTYGDYFVMPYFNNTKDDADIYYVHPKHVSIDQNASDMDDAEHVIVDLYKSYAWCAQTFGKDKADKITYRDAKEVISNEDVRLLDPKDQSSIEGMKNIACVKLFMTPLWFVYKDGKTILKKFRNPLWATDEETQKNDLMLSVEQDYEAELRGKGLIARGVEFAKDKVAQVFGQEVEDKLQTRKDNAAAAFTPNDNYFTYPRIPLIQFDTYRQAGEKYSMSTMQLSIPTVNNLNDKKDAIRRNGDTLAEPTIFYSQKDMSEEDAKRLRKRSDKPIGIPTKSNSNINSIIKEVNGQPLPPQFFNDMVDDERSLDNLWGHHEVSKGTSDPSNKTKGGILALQEADQTPVRLLTRALEDSLQDLFNWVVQIRKVYNKQFSVGALNRGMFIDYREIDNHIRTYVKSGSMLPVSREQQRTDAIDLFKAGALDPLTLYERMNDPNPEQTARRLAAWKQGQILTEDDMAQQQKAREMIEKILQNRFDEVVIAAEDDPKVFHDMLLTAFKSDLFNQSREQQEFVAGLIKQFAEKAGSPIPGAPPTASAQAPEQSTPPPQSSPQPVPSA